MSFWNTVKDFGQDVADRLTPPRPSLSRTSAPAPAVGTGLSRWAEQIHRPSRLIPELSDGAHGEERYSSGWSDPKRWRKWAIEGKYQPEPTPVEERLRPLFGGGIPQTIDAVRRIVDPEVTFDGYLEDNLISPVLTAGEVINDLNDRVADLRRNRVADPEFEYETPQGNTFTSADITPYFEVAGRFITKDQFDEIEKAGVRWLSAKEAHLADDVNDQGEPYSFTGYRLPDGSIVPKESYRPRWVYDALPDGTIFQYADGSKPDEQVFHRQTNAGFWGPKDPRAPWEDRAGNVAFFDEDYDVSESAIDEIIPWFVDLNLKSLPYYVPYYRYASAAARAAPFAQGIAGDTYENDGGLSTLGLGTYAGDSLTNAQALGGAIAPLTDAWMERLSGQTIGGIEKHLPAALADSAAGRWLRDSVGGRILGAAVTEGLEEVPAQFLDLLRQDSLKDYGRSGEYNHRTRRMEYDPDSPRGEELARSLFEAWASGAVLGGGMGVGKELPAALLKRGQRTDARTPRDQRADDRSRIPDPDLADLEPKVERKD